MNDIFNTFQNFDKSSEQLLIDESNSLEIRESATAFKKLVEPCIEEVTQSVTRLKSLVLVCSDELYRAENVWLSKPKIAEASKHEIWEQVGDLTGCAVRISKLANQRRELSIAEAQQFWVERIEYLRRRWFIDGKGQPKKGIGWGEKDGFIKEIKPTIQYQYQELTRILQNELGFIYDELINLEIPKMQEYCNRMAQQDKVPLIKQIELTATEIKTKFNNPTEYLPKYHLDFKTLVSPYLQALVEKRFGDIFWEGDILWEDVVKFQNRVSEKILSFITAIFDDRVELATKAITKSLVFYNNFLEQQERYQQETPEQRQAEKDWIDQQRQELTRVKMSIEAILNAGRCIPLGQIKGHDI